MISVIVPVYNVEKYLKICLDSILKQTFTDFEVIVVNDGATDSCPQICDEYAIIDKRIKVIHKVNGGLVSAWKAGLTVAGGEYICFIDSDDFVAPDYLQCLHDALENDLDMVCMNCVRYFNESKQYNYKINHWTEGNHELDESFYSEFLCWDKKLIANSRWGKLIKTDIVKKYAQYCSEEVSCGEDQQLIIGVLLGCKKVKVIDEYKYFYRCNPHSIMNSYKKDLWNKYKILINTVSKIPEIYSVNDFAKQINGKLLLSMCACIKNEEYCGKGLSKSYFINLFNESKELNLLESYKISNPGKLHIKLITALKAKSFYRIKFLLFLNRVYSKLK